MRAEQVGLKDPLVFKDRFMPSREREREVVRECQREREGNKWWGRHREGKSDRKRESDRERGKERAILRGRDRVVPIA